MWKRAAHCTASVVARECAPHRAALAGAAASVAVARPVACAAARPACRALHTRATVLASNDNGSNSNKPPSSGSGSFTDLDDLFGEEQAIAPAVANVARKASASRLTATLTDTRASTQAAAAAHAAAASIEEQASSLDASLALLDPSNPPRLERKHMELLKHAVKDLDIKLQRAIAQERQANPNEENPTNPNIEHLQKRLAVCRQLVASLFPPEVPGVPFDENLTADILDYAESMPGVLNVMTPDAVDPMKLMAVDHKTTRKNRHIYCLFCAPATARLEKNRLEYTNLNLLTQFVNDRGLILQRSESRLCQLHQRALARTIKRARSIGLMSPMSNWRVDPEFVYGAQSAQFNPHATHAAIGGGSVSTPGIKHAFSAGSVARAQAEAAAAGALQSRATTTAAQDAFEEQFGVEDDLFDEPNAPRRR